MTTRSRRFMIDTVAAHRSRSQWDKRRIADVALATARGYGRLELPSRHTQRTLRLAAAATWFALLVPAGQAEAGVPRQSATGRRPPRQPGPPAPAGPAGNP